MRARWWTVIAVAAATAVAAITATATAAAQDAAYKEPYRPQFHFTPEKNWMNDPNGMVYYDGEYHLFFQHNPFGNQWGHMSWGHAVSKDLVHWEELPVAIPEEGNEMIFSGSAVVDRLNTSGFGTLANPPMVAVYTSAVPGDQYQSVASSTDHGRTWIKRGKVLDDPDPEFRDPKVFWYASEQKWVMVAVKAVQRKVAIYESRNLKDWTHLSDFGPANAVGGVWECPDLFPLMVDGDPTKTKWVMVVSLNPGSIAGGSGTQYFVGDFDGSRFTADNVKDYTPPTGDVYEDFESSTYSPWTTTGNAFGDQPASGNVPPQGGVSGYEGDKLANSFHEEDRGTGTLTSPPFTITRPALNFLIGGGNHPHDPATTDAPPPPGTVFADFEGGSYGPGWTATGTFENTEPAEGSLPGQLPVSGYEGRYLVNTFYDHDNGTGHITSPEFQITTDYINFLVGGGNHPYPGDAGNPPTSVNLIVGGQVVRTSTGQESEALNWTNWNVAQFKGQTARIDIVDENRGGWGHILADQFTFSDQPAFPRSTETAVNLLVDDQVVRTATGKDSERLDWVGWNVRSLIGKTARLQVVDRNTGGWGHILADQFTFSDVKAQSAEERADWLDYGKDYYAAVSWNDVPDGRRLMIGWTNNWQYANQIPTSPWRSAMSVPREVALKTIDGEVQVVQQPVDELRRLRTGRAYHIADQPIVDSARTVERCSGRALEIVAELAIGNARQTGLIVRAGDGEQTVIGYDADTNEVYVDRTRSGRVDFSRNFPGVQRAPLEPRNGKVRLHVLVDWSLIEVYADQGQRVITDQVFPADSSQELKVFAAGGSARLEAMDVWTLRSIWNGESDAGRCAPRAEEANENPGGTPDRGPSGGQGTNRVFGRVASARASTRCYHDAVLARGARTARRSMRFTYRLTAAAPVRLTVRRRNGSPAWTSCPPRRGKKPFRYTDIDTWNEDGQAGENRSDIGTAARIARHRKVVVTRKRPHARGTVSLDRMLRGKHLRAGTYVLTVASLDDTGRVTSERHVKFWVVTPRSSR